MDQGERGEKRDGFEELGPTGLLTVQSRMTQGPKCDCADFVPFDLMQQASTSELLGFMGAFGQFIRAMALRVNDQRHIQLSPKLWGHLTVGPQQEITFTMTWGEDCNSCKILTVVTGGVTAAPWSFSTDLVDMDKQQIQHVLNMLLRVQLPFVPYLIKVIKRMQINA